MRYVALLLALVLSACGSNNPTPPPPPPYSGWSITEYGVNGVQRQDPQPIPSASFAIPGGPLASNWISYVEHPASAISGNLTLSWSITGSNPVFEYARPDNTCGGQATLSLLFRNPGRFFSLSSYQVPLALGEFSLTVPLTEDKWINQDGTAWNTATVTSFGFGLGGGCYAAHGVSVSSGTATFKINGEGAN